MTVNTPSYTTNILIVISISFRLKKLSKIQQSIHLASELWATNKFKHMNFALEFAHLTKIIKGKLRISGGPTQNMHLRNLQCEPK